MSRLILAALFVGWGMLLGQLAACDYKPAECARWGRRHMGATDETEPLVFACPVYKCGSTTTHHEAHDEDVCVAWKP